MVVYNIYGLVYFVEDVKYFKSLENILVFFFENYLFNFKCMVWKFEFLFL